MPQRGMAGPVCAERGLWLKTGAASDQQLMAEQTGLNGVLSH